MSIQTEITRLNTAKANILTSISNKGVDTSSVNTLNDIPPLIDSITGGTGSGGDYNIAVTIDGNTQELAITDAEGSGTNANEVMAGFFNDTIEILDNEFITYTHSYCICNKNKLKIIRLPSVTTLNGYAISSCTAVHTIEFETLTKMIGVSFNGLTALETLIIRTPSVCSLANAGALSRTKIEAGTGYIYVPDNLVDSYKTATNWSTYASQIKGLSEL